MTIDWWTLGIQAVNVVILVWLLGRFFWRPVAAMIAAAPRRGAGDAGRGGGEAQPGGRRARRDRADARRLCPGTRRDPGRGARGRRAGAGGASGARRRRRRRPSRPPRRRPSRRRRRASTRPGPSGRAGSRSRSPSAWPPVSTARRSRAAFLDWLLEGDPKPCRSRCARPWRRSGVALEAISANAARAGRAGALPQADRRGLRRPSRRSPSRPIPASSPASSCTARISSSSNSWRADLARILARARP